MRNHLLWLIFLGLLLHAPLGCGPAQNPRHGSDQPDQPDRDVATAEPGDIVVPHAGLAAPAPTSGPAPAPPRSTASGSVAYVPVWSATTYKGLKKMEDRIVGYVNQLRKRKGLNVLLTDERLRVAARQHTLEMVAKGYYTHTSPVKRWASPAQRACHAGFFDPYVSENIGKVGGYADPAFAMFESWRKSPGHYANMVQTRVRYIGVGLTSVMQGRKLYYGTQLFATNTLDLRKLKVAPQRRRVLRLTVDFTTASGVDVKAWMGRRFVADVPRRGRGARFVMDLRLPRSKALKLEFAVKVGAQTPMVCVHVTVARSGAVSARRNTFDPRCRQVTGVNAKARKLTTTRTVLSGEARADNAKALKTRYYINHQWGPPLKLRLGKWVPFTRTLPGSRTRLSFVISGLMKDYLWIAPSGKPVFCCP
jgi:uncharacterized protein YkwD